jgi:hypothetical protein
MCRGVRVGLVFAALLGGGCGTFARGGGSRHHSDSYLPLEVGAVWRYLVTRDDGQRGSGTVRIEGIDYAASRSDAPEYRVREDLLDGTIWSWEDREPDRVRREQRELEDRSDMVVGEESYDPPDTVLDERPEHLRLGATWSEAFFETAPNIKGRPKSKRVEVKWEVESVTDQVTVPAGTFTCLRVRRAEKHRPPIVSWYARGVGLVRQTGAGALGDQTLALANTRFP